MDLVKRTLAYVRRYWDFLLVDLLAFGLAYVAAVQVRRAMDLRITHGELFLTYGVVAVAVFLFVDVVSRSLSGVTMRGFVREADAVGRQTVKAWSLFTVVLYLQRGGYDFSRAIYVTAFLSCMACVLVARTAWKHVVTRDGLQGSLSPMLLVVCDAEGAQRSVSRVVSGYHERRYVVAGVVACGEGPLDYRDHFPLTEGLGSLAGWLADGRVRDAYVELSDAGEESAAIAELLAAGVAVHRGLGDSVLRYADQRLDELSGRTVVTIEGPGASWSGRARELGRRVRHAIVRVRTWR